jgi:hypothetical protein
MTRRRAVLSAVVLVAFVAAGTVLAGKVVPDVSGTDWFGEGKGKFKVTGQPTDKGSAEFNLSFGEQAGLDPDEFLLRIGDEGGSIQIPGTWTKDKKGRPVFTPDLDATREQVLLMLAEVFPGVPITLEIRKTKLKAKPKSSEKKGDSVKLQALIKSRVEVPILNQKGNLTLAFKGKGTPVQ